MVGSDSIRLPFKTLLLWRHDNQYNDTQHNGTQHSVVLLNVVFLHCMLRVV
jgi:hypothetical protein